jgi:hypothetical protein
VDPAVVEAVVTVATRKHSSDGHDDVIATVTTRKHGSNG